MDIEPTMKYLVSLGGKTINEQKAQKILNNVIYSVGLSPKFGKYSYEEFEKICKKLGERGGKAKIMGITAITQMRCQRILRREEEFKTKGEKE